MRYHTHNEEFIIYDYDLNYTAYKSPDIICSSEGRKFEKVAECIKEAKSGFVSALTSKDECFWKSFHIMVRAFLWDGVTFANTNWTYT